MWAQVKKKINYCAKYQKWRAKYLNEKKRGENVKSIKLRKGNKVNDV